MTDFLDRYIKERGPKFAALVRNFQKKLRKARGKVVEYWVMFDDVVISRHVSEQAAKAAATKREKKINYPHYVIEVKFTRRGGRK